MALWDSCSRSKSIFCPDLPFHFRLQNTTAFFPCVICRRTASLNAALTSGDRRLESWTDLLKACSVILIQSHTFVWTSRRLRRLADASSYARSLSLFGFIYTIALVHGLTLAPRQEHVTNFRPGSSDGGDRFWRQLRWHSQKEYKQRKDAFKRRDLNADILLISLGA